MTVKYHELNPTTAKIELGGREYNLRPFDLIAQVWAHSEFKTDLQPDGLKALSVRIADNTDLECILKTTWHLLKESREIGLYEDFIKLVDKDKNKYLKVMECLQAVTKTMGVSQMQIDELAEDMELKKSLAAGT